MNAMYRILIFLILPSIIISCRKPEDLYGHVHVEGKVIDKVSGMPLRRFQVQLVPYKSQKEEFGFYSETEQNNYGYIPPVYTDTNGNYVVDYESNGFSSFSVFAKPDNQMPEGRLYVPSIYSPKFKLGN